MQYKYKHLEPEGPQVFVVLHSVMSTMCSIDNCDISAQSPLHGDFFLFFNIITFLNTFIQQLNLEIVNIYF